MKKFYGKALHRGIAVGPVAVLQKESQSVEYRKIEHPEEELGRVYKAIKVSKEQLKELYDKTLREVGEREAAIFEVHQMLLEDENYLNMACRMVKTELVCGEYAVAKTGETFSEMFAGTEDEYMKTRAADVKDISNRLIQNLRGRKGTELEVKEPSILVANDLEPSEAMGLDRSKILAIVTIHGSEYSHAAILARMMNIPALIGVQAELDAIESGTDALVDGMEGEFILEPDESLRKEAAEKIRNMREEDDLLQELKGKENRTLSGKKINVYANIAGLDEMENVLKSDAEGIGLVRSEFLYLERNDFPKEEELFQVYVQILRKMGKKKVIIRTLDMGVDKRADYFQLGQEKNPALGYRGIRICLKQPELFRTQLRALFRASAYGNLSIMYPMITSSEEVSKIYEIIEAVKKELAAEQIPFENPEQGIMIETPAAVMISDKLAQMVDFFSIGTNDLTQYTLAVDRQNEKVSDFYNVHHEAIIRMIQMVADNAHGCGKWVGICGELAADLDLTDAFVKMGVDELSVVPSMILRLRKHIRELP